jgi:hypothetical protein
MWRVIGGRAANKPALWLSNYPPNLCSIMIICPFYSERPNSMAVRYPQIFVRGKGHKLDAGGGRFRLAQKVFDENDTAN